MSLIENYKHPKITAHGAYYAFLFVCVAITSVYVVNHHQKINGKTTIAGVFQALNQPKVEKFVQKEESDSNGDENAKPEQEEEKEPLIEAQSNTNLDIAQTIAYISKNNIFTIPVNGETPVQHTFDTDYKFTLIPSPDGKSIAYTYAPKDPNYDYPSSSRFSRNYAGLAILDLQTNNIRIISPYTSDSLYKVQFSEDGKYISTLRGRGEQANVFEAQTGRKVFETLKTEEGRTSNIVFLKDNKISYIVSGNLHISNVDGTNDEVIRSNVMAGWEGHEGPNNPTAPLFSENEKKVAYFRDNGGLYAYDIERKKEYLLHPGSSNGSWVLPQVEPEMFASGDDNHLLISRYRPKEVGIVSLGSQEFKGPLTDIDTYYLTSTPDKKFLVGDLNSKVNKGVVSYYTGTGSRVFCSVAGKIEHKWSNVDGLGVAEASYKFDTSQTHIILNNDNPGKKALQVLNFRTCELYDVVEFDGYQEAYAFSSAVWLPKKHQ